MHNQVGYAGICLTGKLISRGYLQHIFLVPPTDPNGTASLREYFFQPFESSIGWPHCHVALSSKRRCDFNQTHLGLGSGPRSLSILPTCCFGKTWTVAFLTHSTRLFNKLRHYFHRSCGNGQREHERNTSRVARSGCFVRLNGD